MLYGSICWNITKKKNPEVFPTTKYCREDLLTVTNCQPIRLGCTLVPFFLKVKFSVYEVEFSFFNPITFVNILHFMEQKFVCTPFKVALPDSKCVLITLSPFTNFNENWFVTSYMVISGFIIFLWYKEEIAQFYFSGNIRWLGSTFNKWRPGKLLAVFSYQSFCMGLWFTLSLHALIHSQILSISTKS